MHSSREMFSSFSLAQKTTRGGVLLSFAMTHVTCER